MLLSGVRSWPTKWSVYKSSRQTNNDLEGWHSRIYNKISENSNFYILVDALKLERDLVCLHRKAAIRGTNNSIAKTQYFRHSSTNV